MKDRDLETLLQDHYRRAARDIQPDPGLIARAQAAAPPMRVRTPARTRVLMVAVAVSAVFVAGALSWTRLGSPGRQVSSTPVGQGAVVITAQSDRTTAAVGESLHLIGTVSSGGSVGRLDAYLLVRGQWLDVGDVPVAAGRYATAVAVREGAQAVRLCQRPGGAGAAGSMSCSEAIHLTIAAAPSGGETPPSPTKDPEATTPPAPKRPH